MQSPVAQPVRRRVFWIAWQRRAMALIALVGALALAGDAVRSIVQAAGQFWDNALIGALAAFAALLAGLLLWQAFRTRLEVTPDGLEYCELGITIAASWRDVSSIKVNHYRIGGIGGGGRTSVEGLVVSCSQVRSRPIWSRLFNLQGGNDFIPLTPFASNWRSTELGALIRKNAPHLHGAGER